MKLLHQIRHSLSLRLLLLFITAGVVISLLFQGMLGAAIGQHVKQQIAPHLRQYAEYLQQDLGNPPDIGRAKILSSKLPVVMAINTAQTHWQSADIPQQLLREQDWRQMRTATGVPIDYSFERSGVLLRYQLAGSEVLIWGKGWQRPDHRHGGLLVGLLILLVVLALLYYFIRNLFRPIDTIRAGVRAIGAGDLDQRITPARQDELGELAVSINHMADDIQQMLESKRQLLLAISHELRSPLTRAKVSLALLDESAAQRNIERDLREIEAMITELLEAERLNDKHSVLHTSQVCLNELARAVVSEHFPGKAIVLQLAEELPAQALDATRIRLVIRNLLDNALKHQPEQAAEPVILRTMLDRSEQQLVLQVQDHGQGIPAEHLPLLTEPFYRADASRQRRTGGFGLGLYLVKRIVSAHGGTLQISSEPGSGTIVTIRLPAPVPA